MNHITNINPLAINANISFNICNILEIHRICEQVIFGYLDLFWYKSRQTWRSKLHQYHFVKGCRVWSGLLHKYTCSLHVYLQKTEKIHTVNLSLNRRIWRKTCTSVKQGKIVYSIQTNKMSKVYVHSSSTFKIGVHATAVQYYLWYTLFYYLVILRSKKEHVTR